MRERRRSREDGGCGGHINKHRKEQVRGGERGGCHKRVTSRDHVPSKQGDFHDSQQDLVTQPSRCAVCTLASAVVWGPFSHCLVALPAWFMQTGYLAKQTEQLEQVRTDRAGGRSVCGDARVCVGKGGGCM